MSLYMTFFGEKFNFGLYFTLKMEIGDDVVTTHKNIINRYFVNYLLLIWS